MHLEFAQGVRYQRDFDSSFSLSNRLLFGDVVKTYGVFHYDFSWFSRLFLVNVESKVSVEIESWGMNL